MKQVILDTSFIMSCVKQRIDFFEKISDEGMQILIPEQTIDELMALGSQLALDIIGKNKFQLIKIPGKNTDNAIINFAKENPQLIIATLDKALQKKIKNHKMVIRGSKKIEVI